MFDLENEGQTHLCMTFRISGCKHHTDINFVSILTFSRPGISKMLNYVSQTVDVETQGHIHFSYDLAYLQLYACY